MAKDQDTFSENSETSRKISDNSKSALVQFLTDREIESKINEDETEVNFQYKDSNGEPIKVTVNELEEDKLQFYVKGYTFGLTFELPNDKLEDFDNLTTEGFELIQTLEQNGLTVKDGLNYDYNIKNWDGVVEDINGNEMDVNVAEKAPGEKSFNFTPKDAKEAETFTVPEEELNQFKTKSGEEVARTTEEEKEQAAPSTEQSIEPEEREKAAMPFVLKGEGKRPKGARIEELIKEPPLQLSIKPEKEEKIKLPITKKIPDLHLRYKGRTPSQAKIPAESESEVTEQEQIQRLGKTTEEEEKVGAKQKRAAVEERPELQKKEAQKPIVKKTMSNGTKAIIATATAVVGGIGLSLGGPLAYLLLLD